VSNIKVFSRITSSEGIWKSSIHFINTVPGMHCINLVIEFQEGSFGFIVKTIDANLNCLCLILEDAVGTDDMNQAAGADDFLNTTIIEGLTNDITPIAPDAYRNLHLLTPRDSATFPGRF
jgi:hypothetical protein